MKVIDMAQVTFGTSRAEEKRREEMREEDKDRDRRRDKGEIKCLDASSSLLEITSGANTEKNLRKNCKER